MLTGNHSLTLALLLIVFLIISSCQKETVEPSCPPLADTFAPTFTQALFLDLAFGEEFGQSSDQLRKWNNNIQFFIKGSADSTVLKEITATVAELNTLSTQVNIVEVTSESDANLLIFLGTKTDYVTNVEPSAAGIAEGNSGFVAIAWNNQNEIIRSSVCIDVVNFNSTDLLRHVIREELAQSLGLINDTDLDETSIFHQFIDANQSYSEMDRKMITYMLGNELQAGMCKREVMGLVD